MMTALVIGVVVAVVCLVLWVWANFGLAGDAHNENMRRLDKSLATIDRLQRELRAANERCDRATADAKAVGASLQESQAHYARLERQSKDVSAQVARLEADRAETMALMQDAKATLEASAVEIKKLRTELAANAERYTEAVERGTRQSLVAGAANELYERAAAEITVLTRHRDEMTEYVAKLEGQNQELVAAGKARADEVVRLTCENARYTGELDTLRPHVKAQHVRVAELEAEVARLRDGWVTDVENVDLLETLKGGDAVRVRDGETLLEFVLPNRCVRANIKPKEYMGDPIVIRPLHIGFQLHPASAVVAYKKAVRDAN